MRTTESRVPEETSVILVRSRHCDRSDPGVRHSAPCLCTDSGADPGKDQRMPANYPFSAIVGHDDLRLALLLNAVHPVIGGVLVRGEKGTAKSTVVRGLAAVLPEIAVVERCRF